MKIKEILIIGANPDYKDTLLSILPIDGERIQNVDIYQMEIDTDFKIMFYDLDFSQERPAEFWEHIKPHLAGILIIGDSFLSTSSMPGLNFVSDLMREPLGIPIIIGVCPNGGDVGSITLEFKNAGLYLSANTRMMQWNPEDMTSMKNIWRSLLVDLEQSPAQ